MNNLKLLFKILFSIILIIQFSTYVEAQKLFNGIEKSIAEKSAVNNLFNDYKIYTLEASAFDAYIKQSDYQGQVRIQLGTQHDWHLELFEHDIRSSNYTTSVLTPNGKMILPREENITFRGYSQDGGDVRLTVKDNFINGYITIEGERYFIEQANRFTENMMENDYIVYAASDVQPNANAKCGVTDAEDKLRTLSSQESSSNAPQAGDCFRVELAIASDFSMYSDHGSTVGGVTAQTLSVMNNVNGDWSLANGLVDAVEFEIVEQLVSTCNSCDPWSSTTDSGILLGEFNSWGNAGGFNNTFDLGQLWTNRDICRNGSCSVIGLASTGVVCGNSRFHLLEDYTTNSSRLRSLVTHEIGHNFNCPHNYEIDPGCDLMGRATLIMDPTNNGATSWSDGTGVCVMNSIATIDAHINSANVDCLDACAAVTCDPVTGLNITSQTSTSISVSWTGTVGNYRVRVRDMSNNSIVSTMMTTSSSITVTPPLTGCKDYQILVESDCGGEFSEIQGALFQTDNITDFIITDISTSNCVPATYDLSIIVAHGGGDASGFNVTIEGTDYFQTYGTSPQTISINGLVADGNSKSILIAAVNSGGDDCDFSSSYMAPAADCSLNDVVNFDDCQLPSGWTITSTNNLNFSNRYEWKFEGTGRPIQNYGLGSAATATETLNGTCMAYLDDDTNSGTNFTGNITMTTEAFDATPYGSLVLSFDYNFHNFEEAGKGSNNSRFDVDVWDGTDWVNVLTDNDDICSFGNVWGAGCMDSPVIDVAAYINADFQVRFFYTDGNNGAWTGMIALDNYSLTGNLVSLPVELSSFDGRRNNKVVDLNWATSSETNNDYFTLERSADGRNFESLTEVKGSGTTIDANNYQFSDTQPLKGHNYYRLQQTDFDGKSEYVGKIVLVDFYQNGDISIQPNPVKDNYFNLLYSSEEGNSKMEANIYSVNGQLMYSTKLDVLKGQNNWTIRVDDLANGIYILKTLEGNTIKHFKFIKS